MSRSSKILTGIFSFLPILFAIVVLVMVFARIPEFALWDHNEPDFFTVWNSIWPFIMVAIIAGILKLAALIYFIIHMLNNKLVQQGGERIIWVLVFIFTGGIGFPIYWYMRIWKEEI
ncbi:MAG: hypothetical protein EKK37_12575 [Sphingobacteriales bacterium]|nr:MAG: hypothetical protein EKK37_12575 [Sphingobacteriales bacterium]